MCHAWYDKGIELERKSWLEKQDEQNPVWSEEDERIIYNIEQFLHLVKYNPQVRNDLHKEAKYWLKSLKDRYTWKPSDEQMEVLNEVINYAANSELQHWSSFIYTLLKSLREQLKKLREE